VRLIATRATGTTNDAFFDQLVLRALGGVGVHLNGIVTDDGLPAGSTLTTNWTKQSGSGATIFADASQPVTSVVFDTGGGTFPNQMVLKLMANDSALIDSDTVSFRIFDVNQPPVVNAGENQTITLPAEVSLSGSIEDDSNAFFPLTRTWSKLSGPGTVTFSAPNQLATNASLPRRNE
jgi:hypothetical protein